MSKQARKLTDVAEMIRLREVVPQISEPVHDHVRLNVEARRAVESR